MGLIGNITAGMRALFGNARVERELDQELRGFLDASAADKLRSGMTQEDAARAARMEMGSKNAVKHRIRSAGWESILDNFLHDLRFGIRALARSPGFTAVAILSLALGIGANTAIFTLLNAVLLRPLPVSQPQQLVLFGQGQWVGSVGGLPNKSWQLFSYPFYRAFAAQTPSFSGVAAVYSIQMGSHISVSGGNVEHIQIDLVSGRY